MSVRERACVCVKTDGRGNERARARVRCAKRIQMDDVHGIQTCFAVSAQVLGYTDPPVVYFSCVRIAENTAERERALCAFSRRQVTTRSGWRWSLSPGVGGGAYSVRELAGIWRM